MKYVGLQTQIWKNNLRSILLLLAFPSLILFLVWAFCFLAFSDSTLVFDANVQQVNIIFMQFLPALIIGVGIWFLFAYANHSSMIMKATGSKSLERKDNPEIYNLVENLCISQGMKTPQIHIIEDDSLNAFASGINESTYAVSLSRGIINRLNKEELEGVIAHELTHIQNRDVRLLIVSIVFVGIFSFLAEMLLRSFLHSHKKKDPKAIIIALLLTGVGYLFATFFRFGLSRKREFLADAGAVEMTRNPLALASALEKISQDSRIEAVQRKDVAQMFIENPSEKKKDFFSSLQGLFATHPPIEQRIALLKNF